jgi:hypothetical protein
MEYLPETYAPRERSRLSDVLLHPVLHVLYIQFENSLVCSPTVWNSARIRP